MAASCNMEEQQLAAVPSVLDLDTPPPSPPFKRLKLEPASPACTTDQDLRFPGNCQHPALDSVPAQRGADAMQYQQKGPAPSMLAGVGAPEDDLPADFLEPLDITLNQVASSLSSAVAEEDVLRSHRTSLPLNPFSAAPINVHSTGPTSTLDLLPPHLEQLPITNASIYQRRACRHFWKAGDYEANSSSTASMFPLGGIDHVRVHPKFLHSNATSHKWALGAIAELLDNALDEVSNGATFVKVDMIQSPQDGEPMLLFEDDGGGMNPDCLRRCMSLGYSAKSKFANKIGQYGNGFKTSTMRLGSDVLVFTRFPAREGGSPSQSIGLLSYTFLRDTCHEDIIVPMVDYEIKPFGLQKSIRGTVEDWDHNMATITKWSPYHSETELLDQFSDMKPQGTKIILYNLWEDDEGELELDFDADPYDIQVRGANRDEKKIAMAAQYPNSRHYLTYRHSLRSYASILYLRLPIGFQIILRGKEVEHHPLVNDMMFIQERKYKPHSTGDAVLQEANMSADVTIGFVKDAKEHIDVQGFSVYHKNRLIKPFWRIWNAASSQGRGIIAVLEANFVEPAHDKQGFERTVVLSRLEARLVQMQKAYWSNYSHKVGYAKRDTPRVHYPARSILRSEALLTGDRIVTRRGLSLHDASHALHSSQPETFSLGDAMQEEDLLTKPTSNKNNAAADGRKSVQESEDIEISEADSALLIYRQTSPERTNADDGRLRIVAEKNGKLESKVQGLQKVVEDLKHSLRKVIEERDYLKSLISKQAQRRAIDEAELQLKLKAALLQIKQLERDSSCLGVA